MKKIVLTGGPCAGKTEGLNTLKEYFEKEGKTVIIIAETSTQIIESGFKWWDGSIPVNVYQNLIFKYQLDKENIIFQTIEESNLTDVIVLLDRGLMDGKAYMESVDYNEMLKKYNFTEEEILSRYDMVIYLQSVATAEESLFNNENNKSRMSNVEQAKQFDINVKKAWENHINLIEIPFCNTFNEKKEKMKKFIKEN